jgi:hypothetical protein
LAIVVAIACINAAVLGAAAVAAVVTAWGWTLAATVIAASANVRRR